MRFELVRILIRGNRSSLVEGLSAGRGREAGEGEKRRIGGGEGRGGGGGGEAVGE